MDRFASISVFVTAVDEGSLVAAGRRFGLSASMAGKYLSALEAELNVRLLQRSTRSLNLTEAGRNYYHRCKRILEELDDANSEASDAHSTARGTLRVAAPVTFGAMHMGEVVARYLEHHPHVNIEVSLDDRYVDLPHWPLARFATGGAPACTVPHDSVRVTRVSRTRRHAHDAQ
jgi:DNA-binding transcriptional LysR family regulator